MVRSPCVGVCALDERSHTCLGCRRTLDEIAAWPTMTDEERRAVLARLAARRVRRERQGDDGADDRPPAATG